MSMVAPEKPQIASAGTEIGPKSELDVGTRRSNFELRHTAAWIARFAIGFAALAYILRFIDVHKIWCEIQGANAFGIIGAFVLMVMQNVIFAIRWQTLARCTKGCSPLNQATIGNFELAFVSQIVPPAIAGDAVRVFRAKLAGLTLAECPRRC